MHKWEGASPPGRLVCRQVTAQRGRPLLPSYPPTLLPSRPPVRKLVMELLCPSTPTSISTAMRRTRSGRASGIFKPIEASISCVRSSTLYIIVHHPLADTSSSAPTRGRGTQWHSGEFRSNAQRITSGTLERGSLQPDRFNFSLLEGGNIHPSHPSSPCLPWGLNSRPR